LLQSFEKKNDKNFTYNNSWTEIIKVKMRGASKETKKYMRQSPPGGTKGLFGYNLVKDTDNVIVVTEGEFDAMAVYQVTGYPAVSLPQGASNLPDVLLPYFERFDKIYLWMDND
jgi:twinkle protein